MNAQTINGKQTQVIEIMTQIRVLVFVSSLITPKYLSLHPSSVCVCTIYLTRLENKDIKTNMFNAITKASIISLLII